MSSFFETHRILRTLPDRLECYLVLKSMKSGKFSVACLNILDREAVEDLSFQRLTPIEFDIIFGRDLEAELGWFNSMAEAIESHREEFEVTD